MKNFILLSLILFSSTAHTRLTDPSSGSGGDTPPKNENSIPEISGLNISMGTDGLGSASRFAESNFDKRIVQRPKTEVNQYLGDLLTSFSIKLPKGFHSLENLTFKYNSSQFINKGLGIGFSLDLPELEIDQEEIKILGTSTPGVLIPFANNSFAQKRIQKIVSMLDLNEIPVISTFLNQSGEDSSLYVRLVTSNSKHYAQVRSNGETWIFNEAGLPIRVFGILTKGLVLNYNNHSLTSIKDLDAEWEAKFNYQIDSSKWQNYRGQLEEKVNGLKNVELTQGNRKLNYTFQYDGEYLTAVREPRALKVLFQAQYADLDNAKFSTLTEKSSVSFEKNATLSYAADLRDVAWIKRNGTNISFDVDVNGDFYLDKIVLNTDELNTSSQNIFSQYKVKCNRSTHECKPNFTKDSFANQLNSISQKITTYIAVNDNGSIVYKEDKTLSIPDNDVKFVQFEVKEVTRTESDEYNDWKITELKVDSKILFIPKFIDIDGNGKKDILICENDNDLKFEKNLSGIFSGEKQNPVTMSYYNFLVKNEQTVFNEKGNASKAYLAFTDRNLLSKFAAGIENGKVQFVLNASKLKKIEMGASLPCNQMSLPVDFNKDGYADLLTGNKITFFNADGTGKSKVLNSEELKSLFNNPRQDLPIDSHPIELVELKNDGVFDFVQSFGTYIDRLDRTLVYLQDGMRFKVHRPSPVMLLVREKSTFGGFSQVEYDYNKGSALVGSILFSPKTTADISQPQFKKVYSYEGSRFSDQFNILLGHSKSRENIYLESLINGQMELKNFTDTWFDQDFQNGPIFLLQRARRNGRLLKQSSFEADGSQTSYSTYSYGESNELGQDRNYSYLVKKNSFVRGQGTGELISTYDLSLPISSLAFSENRESSQSSDEGISTINKMQFDFNFYLFKKIFTSVQNNSGLELLSPVTQTYNELGQLKTKTKKGITTQFEYDSLGRVISTNDQRGKSVQNKYHANTPLISDSISDGNSQHVDYEFITNLPMTVSKNNARTDHYRWSSDEILLSVKRDEQKIYQIKKHGNKFKIIQGDLIRTLSLDGFGRVVKVEREADGEIIVEKAMVLNENDKTTKLELPHFENEFQNVFQLYSYDAIGRVTSDSLVGTLNNRRLNFTNESIYSLDGTQTKIEQLAEDFNKKSIFQKNERAFTVAYQTVSENVTFGVDSFGNIKKVNELSSDYSYDLYGKLKSTEANADFSWNKMFQTYNPAKNISYSTTGLIENDAYGRLVNMANSTSQSKFQKTISYERGLPLTSSLAFDDKTISERNAYDLNDFLVSTTFSNVKKEFAYDEYDRPKAEVIQSNGKNLDLNYEYANGQLSTLNPFIDSIEYDAYGRPYLINFSNQTSLSFSYDIFQKLEAVQVNLNNGKILGINYSEELNGKASKLYSSARYYGLAQDNKNYSYDERLFLKKEARLNLSQALFDQSNVTKFSQFQLKYENDLLTTISHPAYGKFKNYVSPDKKWQGTCPEKFSSMDECFLKLNSDEFLVQGEYVRAIRVAGKILGVLYKNQFYPALTDHQNTVLALVSPEGDSLVFERKYNEWGEKIEVVGDKAFEKKIPWAYAGLIQHPFFNGEVLQSETRLYIPSLGIWTSADNLVKWNPNALKDLPGNWQPLLYASGDPVNFVDPSGHYSLSASDGAGFSLMFNEQLKVADFEKWNSSESRAYRKEALQNLGKASLVGVGMLATAGGAPEIAAGAKLVMTGVRALAIAGNLEFNVARVSVGSFVAKNPEKVKDIISNGVSILDHAYYDGYGNPPSAPDNYIDVIASMYKYFKGE